MEAESVETDIGAFDIERELREVERDLSVGEKDLGFAIQKLTNKLDNTLPVSKPLHSLALFRELPYDLNSGDSFVYTNYLKRKGPNM